MVTSAPKPPLRVPAKFTSLQMLKFHVEQHHGYYMGDIKTLREGVKAHLTMHTDPAPPTFGGAYPHIHDNVSELTVITFD